VPAAEPPKLEFGVDAFDGEQPTAAEEMQRTTTS
jgi:hypothetical protein